MGQPEQKLREYLDLEVSRQLERSLQKVSNALTRSSIIFAASGVTTLYFADVNNGLVLLCTSLLSLVASVISACSIWLWPSKESRLTAEEANLYFKLNPESFLSRQIWDKLIELETNEKELRIRNRLILASLILLMLGWFAQICLILIPIWS